jgi:hypothetical protein
MRPRPRVNFLSARGDVDIKELFTCAIAFQNLGVIMIGLI